MEKSINETGLSKDNLSTILYFLRYHKIEGSSTIFTSHPEDYQEIFGDLKFRSLEGLNQGEADKILDLSSFIKNKDEKLARLEEYIGTIKNLGTIFFLTDRYSLSSIYPLVNRFTSENKTVNILIKFTIIDYEKSLLIFSFQKFVLKQEVDASKIKAREIIDLSNSVENNITPQTFDFKLEDIEECVISSSSLYSDKSELSELQKGRIFRTLLMTYHFSNRIYCSITVIDSNKQANLDTKLCKALIVASNFSSSTLEMIVHDYESLIQQFNVARLIIVRPSKFGRLSIEELKNSISSFLNFYLPSNYKAECEILQLKDTRTDKSEVFRADKYSIVDTNDKSDCFHRFVYDEYGSIVDEIGLESISKKDSKASNIKIVATPKSKEGQGVKYILKETGLDNFEYQIAMASFFFLKSLETIEPEILVLKAGCGVLSYFLNTLFKSKCNITSVELDDHLIEVGSKYLGVKLDNINYSQADSKQFVFNSSATSIEKYNLIFLANGRQDPAENTIVPSMDYFSENFLKSLYESLNSNGVLVISINAANKFAYRDALNSLKTIFGKVFFIDTFDELNRIHFVLKTNLNENEILYLDRFKPNLDLYNESDRLKAEILGENYKIFFEKLVMLE